MMGLITSSIGGLMGYGGDTNSEEGKKESDDDDEF